MRHYFLFALTIAGHSGGVLALAPERSLVTPAGLAQSVLAGQRRADTTKLLPVVARRTQQHEGVAEPAPETARRR